MPYPTMAPPRVPTLPPLLTAAPTAAPAAVPMVRSFVGQPARLTNEATNAIPIPDLSICVFPMKVGRPRTHSNSDRHYSAYQVVTVGNAPLMSWLADIAARARLKYRPACAPSSFSPQASCCWVDLYCSAGSFPRTIPPPPP